MGWWRKRWRGEEGAAGRWIQSNLRWDKLRRKGSCGEDTGRRNYISFEYLNGLKYRLNTISQMFHLLVPAGGQTSWGWTFVFREEIKYKLTNTKRHYFLIMCSTNCTY